MNSFPMGRYHHHSRALFVSFLLAFGFSACNEEPINPESVEDTNYRLVAFELIDISGPYGEEELYGSWGMVYVDNLPALNTYFRFYEVSPGAIDGAPPIYSSSNDVIITYDYEEYPNTLRTDITYDAFDYNNYSHEELVDAFFDGERILAFQEGWDGANHPLEFEDYEYECVYTGTRLSGINDEYDEEWSWNWIEGDIAELSVEGEVAATYQWSNIENVGNLSFMDPFHFFPECDCFNGLGYFTHHLAALSGSSTVHLPSEVNIPEGDVVWATYEWNVDENQLPVQLAYTFMDINYDEPITLTYAFEFEAY